MVEGSFQGQVAVVTGAASGIGHAAADAGGSPRNHRDLPIKRERAHDGNPILQPLFAVT